LRAPPIVGYPPTALESKQETLVDIRRILVIYKKSVYELYALESEDPSFLAYLEREEEARDRIINAHHDNLGAIESVCSALEEAGMVYECDHRARKRSLSGFDAVVAIGGDGTLLDASHAIRDIPIIGVNSSPSFSVGHYCTTHAPGFPDVLRGVLAGEIERVQLQRLRVQIGTKVIPHPVLNEILFAHQRPAATARFRVELDDRVDDVKSSGIWIATPTGSTGAIGSAGGDWVHHEDPSMQYVVREVYADPESPDAIRHGHTTGPIRLMSGTRRAAIFVDGHRLKYNVGYGIPVTIDLGAPPLHLFHTHFAQQRKTR
jgi:NAD+ kinase